MFATRAKCLLWMLAGPALLSACSDGSLEPPQGAISLRYGATTTGSKAPVCPPLDHVSNAPVALDGTAQVTGAGMLSRAIDGRAGDWVKCRVAPQGDQYAVTAEIVSTGLGPSGAEVTADLLVQVTLGEDQAGVQGTVHASDDATGIGRYVSDACLFSVQADSAENARLGVAPGRFWASVRCAQIDDMRNFAGNECALTGYVAVDHCSQ
jgi:hypothetical protein